MERRPSFFVSYAHADEPIARRLAGAVESRGFPVWIDVEALRVGDSIVERIANAVNRIDFFVALVSEAAIASRWCQKELALAMTGQINTEGVKVLPIRVGTVDMPASLEDVFYLEFDPEAERDPKDPRPLDPGG